ncbi:MAG: lysophospholipid acyltransferase family protein, partial [Thiomicrospira sp.]
MSTSSVSRKMRLINLGANLMLNLEHTLNERFPQLQKKPGAKLMIKLLKALTHEDEINQFIESHQHLRGFRFLDKVLDYFNFGYQISDRSLHAIPAEGRVIIVANHPIGSLDGLALLKLVRSVRADVRIVANDLLAQIEPIRDLFIPLDNMSVKSQHKTQYKTLIHALQNDEAIIIFPAGEVSRIRPNGVRDGKWKTGFLRLAEKTRAPILPILVEARNSALFYSLSALYKPLGTLMLVQEMFNKDDQEIVFHVGKLIPWKAIGALQLSSALAAARMRKHLYRLNQPKKLAKNPLFEGEITVAHPVDRKALKKALKLAKKLGQTGDGKIIYLYDYEADSPVMQEIGRLRELTFRTVEEGTGARLDLDEYDSRYRHLILWDEDSLDIVGAYRIGECAKLIEQQGLDALYTHSLFELHDDIVPYLNQAIELGRSFVQPRYWGLRSLDYLWYGIGAYIQAHPHIRYLFGPVSLSGAYPEQAKQRIVGFYQQQFGSWSHLASAKHPYELTQDTQQLVSADYAQDYATSFKRLNRQLEQLGVKVPTLYKQYSELCDDQGCHFISTSIDPHFGHCLDSLILVELDKIKDKKRQRYLSPMN